MVAKYQDVIGKICDKAGYPLDKWSMSCISHIYDTTVCDKANGLKMPDWIDEDMWTNMTMITEESRKLSASDANIKRFQVGGGQSRYVACFSTGKFSNDSFSTNIWFISLIFWNRNLFRRTLATMNLLLGLEKT